MAHNHLNCNNSSNDFFHDIEKAQMTKNKIRVEETKKKIIDLTKQIEKAENINLGLTNQLNSNDWTQTYEFWNKWEDIEDLVQEKESEKSRLQNFIEENNFMGHCNDHTEVIKYHNHLFIFIYIFFC